MKRIGFMRSGAPILLIACVLVVAPSDAGDFSIPASVEDVLRYSDLVAVGKVTKTDAEATMQGGQVVTRHTFKVEAYYKGSGPEEIDLITQGGVRHLKVGDEVHPIITQSLGSEGVRVGDELLAFLSSGPGGYYFAVSDGAKYLVNQDSESEERKVSLRLRKKKYMRGVALEGFKRLEGMEGGSDTAAGSEASLPLGKFQTEPIPLEQLQARLAEIIKGETNPR